MTTNFQSKERAREATSKLLAYCQTNGWAGYDPYDALNSRLFTALPILDSRIPRLVMTQALKRAPFNVRPLLRVPKTQNPKALALFLSSLLNLDAGNENQQDSITGLIRRISELRSAGSAYWCWGYSFPWQTRTIVVPAGAPNLVCTAFVANSLMDAYELRGDTNCLEMAMSAAEYMLKELYWSGEGSVAGFAYPLPSRKAQVHNANFLAAALLCRVFKHTGDTQLRDAALRVARHSVVQQKKDGSWAYGEEAKAQWIDNFHTGYNLCALRSMDQSLDTDEFEDSVRRGFEFYCRHFFREDGAARYFHNKTYPIDIHATAQSIVTLVTLQDLNPDSLELAHKVLDWALDNMYDERGFFYYRVLRALKIKTSYMRWSQAWMLYAMSMLLKKNSKEATPVASPVAALNVC